MDAAGGTELCVSWLRPGMFFIRHRPDDGRTFVRCALGAAISASATRAALLGRGVFMRHTPYCAAGIVLHCAVSFGGGFAGRARLMPLGVC